MLPTPADTLHEIGMIPAIALDPGATTGWSARIGPVWEAGQCVNYQLTYVLDRINPLYVVYESFNVRPGTAFDHSAIETIGIIKNWLWQNSRPGRSVITQSSSEAKFFWTNNKLKKVGLHTPGKDHMNDAVRHMLTWLSKYDKTYVKLAAQ